MRTFLYLLKRDLRHLVAPMIIFIILLIMFFGGMAFIYSLADQPFTIGMAPAFIFLLFWLVFFNWLALNIEVVWKEWRQGTETYWYTLPGSLHAKFISKILAVWLAQLGQVAVAAGSFYVASRVMVEQAFQDVLADVFTGLGSHIVKAIGLSILSPTVSIITIILLVLFIKGIKNRWRFIAAAVLFIISFIVYPSLFMSQYGNSETIIETGGDTFTFSIFLEEASIQPYTDLLMIVLLYSVLWFFCQRKIEI